MRDEEEGDWRRLHLLFTNTTRVIKSRRKWAGQAACMGEMRNAYKILKGKIPHRRP
jgi:hypothetical protein